MQFFSHRSNQIHFQFLCIANINIAAFPTFIKVSIQVFSFMNYIFTAI